MKSLKCFALVSGLLAASGSAAFAQTATYTFEAPIFAQNNASPNGLNNKAPNSGSSGVTASFTSSPLMGKAEIDNNGNGPINPPGSAPTFSSQFSGLFLNSIATNQTITVTLNTSFTDLSLDFYLDGPGMLNLNASSGGSASQVGTLDAVTGNTYTGTLNFSSATPFNSFTLVTAATTGGRPAGFGIDNLHLTTASPTPAPGSALVLGVGLLYPLAGLMKRRRQKGA